METIISKPSVLRLEFEGEFNQLKKLLTILCELTNRLNIKFKRI